VRLSGSRETDDREEVVEYNASEVLMHNSETRTWEELGADPQHQQLQMSLAVPNGGASC
jgi:hypothetical protein